MHDLQSSTKIIYNSIRHAALALNFNRHTTISYLASGTPYLGRYLFQRVDNFDPLPVNASSSYLEIEASLNKIEAETSIEIEASLKKIQAKISSLNSTLARVPKSTRGPGTSSDIRLVDSKFKVLDLETNGFTYYNSIRQIARAFSCGHSAVQYSLNNPSARYKGRYIITKLSSRWDT